MYIIFVNNPGAKSYAIGPFNKARQAQKWLDKQNWGKYNREYCVINLLDIFSMEKDDD